MKLYCNSCERYTHHKKINGCGARCLECGALYTDYLQESDLDALLSEYDSLKPDVSPYGNQR
jgi:hypothetical protein